MSPLSTMEYLEGPGYRRWYVAEWEGKAPTILSGPFRSRQDGRHDVARIARERGERRSWWPDQEIWPDYPGFSVQRTEERVYYVARASAMCDQGHEWCRAIGAYEVEKGIRDA